MSKILGSTIVGTKSDMIAVVTLSINEKKNKKKEEFCTIRK